MSRLQTLFRAVFNAPSISDASFALVKQGTAAAGLLRAVRGQQASSWAPTSPATTHFSVGRWLSTSFTTSASAHLPYARHAIPGAAATARQALFQHHRRLGLSTVAAAATTAAKSSSASSSIISTAGAAFTAGLTPGMRRALTVWLAGGSAWVFSMVALGGITRLTRSGLSMTDWKFTGERPPQTTAEWETEFNRYKQSPEYQMVNSKMSIDEFQFIYWMEWAHRMWGRGLGLFFALPCAAFAVRGAINAPLARRLGLLFLMGGCQGLVGWWMVRSGLVQPSDNQVPRVSPYRLAAHLTSAFAIYASMVWTTLQIAVPQPPAVTAGPAGVRAASALYRVALPAAVLLGLTAISGAFVAGNDAGHAYNTFPTMNGEWIPSEYFQMSGWRNMFENTAAVQLHHRALALTTLVTSLALWRYGTRMPDLPRASRLLLNGLAVGVGCQVTLGVATLLTYVPVTLGTLHQSGAMTLFTIMLALLYTVRPVPTLAPFRLLTTAPFSTVSAAAAVIAVGGAVVNTV